MNDREDIICRLKELNHSHMFCTLDTLVRIDDTDEDLCSCQNCVFRDTNEFVDFLGCPFNWGCTFGTYKSMVK